MKALYFYCQTLSFVWFFGTYWSSAFQQIIIFIIHYLTFLHESKPLVSLRDENWSLNTRCTLIEKTGYWSMFRPSFYSGLEWGSLHGHIEPYKIWAGFSPCISYLRTFILDPGLHILYICIYIKYMKFLQEYGMSCGAHLEASQPWRMQGFSL